MVSRPDELLFSGRTLSLRIPGFLRLEDDRGRARPIGRIEPNYHC